MQPCYLYAHLRRKIRNAIVTRSEQPTRRWQLPSASRLQLARGSSTAHCVVMSLHSLHTGRPPCWEFVLAPFAPRARKLGCALVCNEFWLGLKGRSQFLELVFGSFASHSAAHVVVICSFFWVPKKVPVLVALGCALGCNGFLFLVPKMVPILGTCFDAPRAHN